MIAANKRLIKANLSQGVVGIQSNLIGLYQSNLNAVGVSAALIAGFSFSAVTNGSLSAFSSTANEALGYFYYSLFTISFVTSLWTLAQSTVSTMFGPSLALKGESEDSVQIASDYMRDQQTFVFSIGCVAITSLFMGACVLSWAIYPVGIAVITTFGYVIGYYCLAFYGIQAYNTFVPPVDVTLDVQPIGSQQSGYVQVGQGSELRSSGSVVSMPQGLLPNDPHELKKTKHKGIIWQRMAAEEGGLFFKCYGTLKDGRLDFFRNEKEFLDHLNPLNKKPYKMWQFNVETDQRKFARQVTSLRNTMKAAMLGGDGQDFAVGDLFSSEYDLPYAAKHYRFALMPKVSSELQSVDNVELLAHDDQSFKEWVNALRTVAIAYDDIAALPTIDKTMRMGRSDVEVVVQAANV